MASRTHARKVHAGRDERRAELEARAWELRKAGASFRAIGKELGFSHDTAFKYVNGVLHAVITSTREVAESARAIDAERLDTMLLALAAKIRAGNVGAIDAAVRIMARRARMFGYDAPQVVDASLVVTPGSGTSDSTALALSARQRLDRLLKGASTAPVIDVTPIVPGNGNGHGNGGGNGHGG